MNHGWPGLTSPYGGQQRMNLRKYYLLPASITEERAVELTF